MRIGVFICHCGNNIAATVDVEQVAAAIAKLPGVVVATTIHHACSEGGQRTIRQAIKEQGLTRVVVAACSPRVHEATFKRAVESAGLNPYLLEIANIREQCSWIHDDREQATIKATRLVGMAVARARRLESLTPGRVRVNKKTLVIGGGIAGIQAALDLADGGHKVVLVERQPSIGGNMARMDKIFPTLDCSSCVLSPKMVEVARHPNIELYTYAEIEQVSGFVGNFKVTIRRRARFVDLKKCTGCGACSIKCPIKAPSEFNLQMDKRPAVYTPFPQAIPQAPVIDKTRCTYLLKGKCGLCRKICPSEAIDYEQQDQLLEQEFGAIIVATGYSLVDWKSLYGEYGYGRYPDVISSLQYERLMSASGPTGGCIRRPSDGREPRNIVIIACVGSRDPARGRPYCSSVCCMYSAKYAILTKEHIPEAQVMIFYMDIRATGKMYEEFVLRAREQYAAQYIRGRVSEIFQKQDKLIVRGSDTLLGRPVEVAADLVVLAVGIDSAPDAKELAKKLNISHDEYGFFTESHPKLRPVESSIAGIFIAGACQAPKDIPMTVAQASSAASKVMDLLSRDELQTSPLIAEIDVRRCVGCMRCLKVCPFQAISEQTLRDGRKVAQVQAALCQGCGLCSATCLPGAIYSKGFSDDQLIGAIEALCRSN